MNSSHRYTRRAAIGLAAAAIPAGLAVVADAGCGPQSPAGRKPFGRKPLGRKPASAKRSGPRHRPVSENSRPGDPNWDIRHVGPQHAIMGYAGQASVRRGDPLTLYVSTVARSFTASAFRMGWYGGDQARLVHRSAAVTAPTNTVEATWGPSVQLPTDDWPEGSYLIRLDAESGQQRFVPVTVRSDATAGKVVIKNAVQTWQAYNAWGGYSLYHGPGGAGDYGNRSLAVSLDRPYDADGAYMFRWHERKLIELAEYHGLPLAYVTSMDIDADPGLLDGASALVSLGHDEYWTPAERAHVTSARDAGMNIAFLGANAMFRRTRLAPTRLGPRRQVICYKTSYLQDPLYGKDNALVTSDWREPPDPDPESSLTGTLYESNPVDAAYVVATPDAWPFRQTGVDRGTRFTGLVGIEYDRVNPGFPVERPIQVLSHSPLKCRGVNSYSDSAYYTHRGGAGVLNTGTMRWVASLGGTAIFGLNARTARFTKRVTTNVLHAFADGPAAARYRAQDNLVATAEWAGDPIAAGRNLWPPTRL